MAVQENNRIVVPARMVDCTDWLRAAGESIDVAFCWLGDAPGFQLVPTDRLDLAMLPEIPNARQRARVAASRWPATAERHARNYRLTIPTTIVQLGLLPAQGGQVALLAFGGIVELWPAHEWPQWLRRTAERREPIPEDLVRRLEATM